MKQKIINPKYEDFKKNKNLKQIENSEIVFDVDNRDIGFEAINLIGVALYKENYCFEIYYAQGQKSPHLHIKNILFLDLEGEQLKKYKELFLRKYCPKEFLKDLDFALCGKHLIAEENKPHFKYKTIKKLCGVFNENSENWAEEELINQVKNKILKRNVVEGSGITSEINKKISIIEIAERYGISVKKNKAICPFHNDSNPSLSFENNRNLFNCFGCQAHGNIVDFIYLLRKNKYKELLK